MRAARNGPRRDPMDLLYASLAYPPSLGGGEILMHNLARRLGERGHGVRVVTQWSRTRRDWIWGATAGCDPRRDYVHEGVDVRQMGFEAGTRLSLLPWAFAYKQRWGRARAISRIATLMRAELERAAGPPPDLVHGVRIGREFLPRAAFDASRRWGVPFVITSLHHPNWTGPRHRHYAELYRRADAVIALTEYERRLLVEEKRVDAERVHVTGSGPVLAAEPDVEAFRARYDVAGPYVLFIGRKAAHKGWDTLLAAAPALFAAQPEVTLLFVGQDSPASTAAFGALSEPRVRNLGAVDLATKTAALAGCEVMCLPSTSESFGIVFTEAWALGKPVVGCAVPPIDDVVAHGEDGLLVAPEPGPLAEALVALLGDAGTRERLGAAGRRKVEARYGWECVADATLAVYEAALAGRPVAPTDSAAPSGT